MTADQPSRAEKIAGVRELADWLEANPDAPLPWWADVTVMVSINNLDGMGGASDEVRLAELVRIADLMGVTADLRDEPAAPHPHADKVFRGRTAYRLVLVTDAYRRDYKDIPGAGEEVVGPGAGSATAPAESSPAGPVASADDPPADAVSGDSRPQDRPGTAAVPAPDSSGDGAAVAPDVWVAVRRRGVTYHDANGPVIHGGTESLTVCGRSMRTGSRLPLAEARDDLGGVRCVACHRKSEG